jgi:large subunit ribosomal protein L29
MAKAKELRDMADDQIRLVWKDAAETLFRLRIQAQTEKLAAPTEMRKQRRTIARCQTILSQRGTLAPAPPAGGADESPRHEKHAKKHRASGRAKVRSVTKGRTESRRTFKKRTQSGT